MAGRYCGNDENENTIIFQIGYITNYLKMDTEPYAKHLEGGKRQLPETLVVLGYHCHHHNVSFHLIPVKSLH